MVYLWVFSRNKPTTDVGRTREKLVNLEPPAHDLQLSVSFLPFKANKMFKLGLPN